MSHPPQSSPILGSMLWAAYGDALGFMSELVTTSVLELRTGFSAVSETTPWKYRMGGRYGTQVSMPAGAYSDDTQLRLATARAIGRGGVFNVDAFSKVELPVWLSYALGAGRGTRAAAANLSRDNVTWFANFYGGGPIRQNAVQYVESGGNGAAMRIQPHVWASAPGVDVRALILNVLRNAVVTHGHPRALVGAAFYALVLADTLHRRQILMPEEWLEHLKLLREIPSILAKDQYLGLMWLPEWERQVGGSFQAAIFATVDECREDIALLSQLSVHSPAAAYQEYLSKIGAFLPATRGSGTKSAVAALALGWLFRNDPDQGMISSANALGSDTDTIGSMGGALLGVISPKEPPGALQDKMLLIEQAERLASIAAGADLPDFSYPSLLAWKPPRNASDSVGRFADGVSLVGLGEIRPIDRETYASNERQPTMWRWVRSWFGQTLLVKMRQDLPELSEDQMPQKEPPLRQPHPILPSSPPSHQPSGPQSELNGTRTYDAPAEQATLFGDVRDHREMDLDRATQKVINSNFDEGVIGALILRLSEGEFGIENAVAFAAIIAKARRARRRRATP